MYSRHTHHHHSSNYNRRFRQTDSGVALMFIGLLVSSPIIFWLGFIEYASAPMLLATSSVTLLGLSTIALGAIALYGSIGITYLFSGAKECYDTDKSPLGLLKSRITENSFNVKGVINTLGAILWSPFLLIGGISGVAARAVSNAFRSEPEVLSDDEIEIEDEEVPENEDQKKAEELDLNITNNTQPLPSSPALMQQALGGATGQPTQENDLSPLVEQPIETINAPLFSLPHTNEPTDSDEDPEESPIAQLFNQQ